MNTKYGIIFRRRHFIIKWSGRANLGLPPDAGSFLRRTGILYLPLYNSERSSYR